MMTDIYVITTIKRKRLSSQAVPPQEDSFKQQLHDMPTQAW